MYIFIMSDAESRNLKNPTSIKSSKFVSSLITKNTTSLLTISICFLFVASMIMSVGYYSPIVAYAKSKKTDNETSSSENNAPLTELGKSANTEESDKNPSSSNDNNNNPQSLESSDKNNAPLTELGKSNLDKIIGGGVRVNQSDLGGIKLPPGGGIKVPPGDVIENPPDGNAPPPNETNPTTPPSNDNTTTGGTGGNNNTNTNGNNNTNTNTNNNTNINQNTLVNQNTIKNSVKINNQINNIIRQQTASSSATATTTTSPTSKGPLVDLETISLGKSVFAAGGIRPLADVFPFHVIGGHISLNSVSGNTVNLIVAQITDRGVEHAVVVNLHQTLNVIAGKEILYHTDLGQVISGTNPFSGKPDTVSNVTDLILWNNSVHDVLFNDDNAVTMTIIYQ